MIRWAARDLRVAVFLASRSLWRGNAGVTLMTVLMMAVVFISVMFLPSLINGAVSAIEAQVTETATSDLNVTSAQRTSIGRSAQLVEQIGAVPGVAAVARVRRVGTQVRYGELSNAWGVDAVDPEGYAAVFTTPDHMIEGDWLTAGDRQGIVLGIDIAGADQPDLRGYAGSLKHVHAGDEVEIELLGGSTATFTVRGIYRNNFALSDMGAFITTDAADALEPTTDLTGAVERLFDAVDQLTGALEGAHDGAAALAGGQAALAGASHDVAQAAHRLASEAKHLAAAGDQAADGAVQLSRSTHKTATSAGKLAEGANTLSGTVTKTMVPASDAAAADAAQTAQAAAALAQSCPVEVADSTRCAQQAALAQDAADAALEVGTAAAQLRALSGSIDTLASSAKSLDHGTARLAKAATDLSRGVGSLSSGTGSLRTATDRLASAATRVAGQADVLDDASQELSAGLDVEGEASVDDQDRTDLEEALTAPKGLPGPGRATRVYVKTGPGGSVADVERAIDQLRDGLRYQTTEELSGAIQDQIDSFALVDSIMRVISLAVAAITVFILTYVELTNRRRQIGIERAIGIRGGAIVTSYAMKAAVSALVGIMLGFVTYRAALIPLVRQHPFQFPNGDVVLVANAATTRSNVILLMIVAVLAALVPTAVTMRMKLLDAIWGK